MAFRSLVLLMLLVLAACGGSSRDRPGKPAPRPPAASKPSPEFQRQMALCRSRLLALEVRFNILPDRTMGGGCSTWGTVQLLDIGMPTTNLGALRCPLAEKFAIWAREALQPAARAWLDSPVVKVESMGSYACRPVNGRAGNRLSEHALANAVDVSGFVLASGRRITVKADWNGPDSGARDFLRAVHASACRRFVTVLGPSYNALHADHFHFDMGGSRFCR